MDNNYYLKYMCFDDAIPYVSIGNREFNKGFKSEINRLKIELLMHSNDEKLKQTIKELEDTLSYQTLYFKPIKMKDVFEYYSSYDCFMVDKNVGKFNVEPKELLKLIKMSYLDYIFYITNEHNYYSLKLKMFLKISLGLRDDEIDFSKDEKDHIIIKIKGINYTGEDFDEMRKIICTQNGIDIPDESIHPDVRRALEEAKAFKNKQNGVGKPGTLDDQILCMQIILHEPNKEIIKEKMTIRTFNKILAKYSYKFEYQVSKTGMIACGIELPKGLQSWTNNFDKTGLDKYSDVMVDVEEMQDKVDKVNGKRKKEDKK